MAMRPGRWIYAMRMRLRSLFRREGVDRELDEELEYHVEMKTEENIAKGMTREQARRAALIDAGGIDQAKEKCRDARGVRWIHDLAQDFRFGLRMMRKNPGFTELAIFTLALGIGANTAIFSLVNVVMLKTLPVQQPGQLVLFTWYPGRTWPPNFGQTGADPKYSFSYPQFDEMRRQNQSLSSMFAFVPLGFSHENATVMQNGDATSANGMMVTGEYFSGLGVAPVLGRAITEADEQPGAARVAVISFAYWNSRFARARSVIGSNMTVNGIPFTIVGVLPPEFYGLRPGDRPDLWIAFDDAPELRPWSARPAGSESVYTARNWICLNVVGRLKPGVSWAQAQAALDVAYRQSVTRDWKPQSSEDVPSFSLSPADQGLPYLRRFVSQPLMLLMAAVGVVLLIACANVATLLLARASTRSKEVSVRLAMGASRSRLLRQLLTESIMMSTLGSTLGFLFARWGTRALLALPQRGQFAVMLDTRPDTRVLLFTMTAALFTGLLFGVAPAWRASRVDLVAAMKDARGGLLGGRDRHRLGQSLVVLQVAGSLVLMIAAGLFVRTLMNFTRNDFGFQQENLLTFGIDATRDGHRGDRLIELYSQLLDRIQSLPGVDAATQIQFPTFTGTASNQNISIVGEARRPANSLVRYITVGPDFFETMRIPVVLGRGIQARDDSSAPKVVVIDQTLAKNFFGDENPLGRRLLRPGGGDSFEIVGVAKPAELTDVHAPALSKAYFSYQQLPRELNSIFFEVRSSGNPEGIVSEIREAVRQSDSNLPLLSLQKQSEIRDDALTGERVMARFSALFGVLGLVLAAVGLYGTIAYAVARKTHEIGIRVALGARSGDVLWMVVMQGVRLAAAGVVIGTVAAFGVTRLVRNLIFGVTPTDPLTFVGVIALLMAVAIAACLIPARRAMRVDPMVALRHE
jgi:predicted permease